MTVEPLRLFYGQRRLIEDRSKQEHAIIAGLGSGKSTLIPRWHFSRCLINRKSSVSLMVAPDSRLLTTVSLPAYESFLLSRGMIAGEDFKIYLSKGDTRIVFRSLGPRPWGHSIFFLSGEAVEKIVGYNASHAALDEVDTMTEEVVFRVQQRLRCPDAELIQMLLAGTPEGLGVLHKRYHPDECKPSGDRFSESDTKLVLHARTYDNYTLPPQYLESLEREYGRDSAEWQCYVEGVPTSLSKERFYYRFTPTRHVIECPPDPANPTLIWALDNNPVVLSTTWIQPDANRFLIVADNGGRARDVVEACEQFVERFPPHTWGRHAISVLGDPALHARSPLTHQTGYEIIRSLLKPHYPNLSIDAPRASPLIRERYRNTNKLFFEDRLYIDKRALKVIESAASVEMQPDGRPKKLSKDQLTHSMESIDFALMVLSPPQGPRVYQGLK